MSDADRRRWDERYAATGTIESAVPTPPDVLRSRDELVPSAGRALDVACGCGASTVWLAQRGLVVDAVDISSAGLAAGAALADRHGVGDRVRWWRHDLDHGLPADCGGRYDLVVCQRFRDPALYPVLERALAPGGLLAITVLSSAGGRDGVFRAASGELRAAFEGVAVLAYTEGDGEAHLLARRLT